MSCEIGFSWSLHTPGRREILFFEIPSRSTLSSLEWEMTWVFPSASLMSFLDLLSCVYLSFHHEEGSPCYASGEACARFCRIWTSQRLGNTGACWVPIGCLVFFELLWWITLGKMMQFVFQLWFLCCVVVQIIWYISIFSWANFCKDWM